VPADLVGIRRCSGRKAQRWIDDAEIAHHADPGIRRRKYRPILLPSPSAAGLVADNAVADVGCFGRMRLGTQA
jgi:hypothetical protein